MASVIKRGDGWNVRYFDRTGSRRSKQFDKKKDADRFRVQVEAEAVERGFGTHIEDVTIAKAADDFVDGEHMRWKDGRIGQGRFESIEMACRIGIKPYLGKMKLAALTAADVENWYGRLRNEGKLTVRTAKDRVRELKLLCDFGVRQGYCRENVVVDAQKRLRGGVPTKVRTFSRDNVHALLSAAEQRFPGQHDRSRDMLRCVVHLAAFCGLRYGEIFGLRRQHVLIDAKVIEVRHSLTEWDELKGPKTAAGIRDVPLPAHLAAMLAHWLDRWTHPDDRDLVFRVGTPAAPKMLQACNFHTAHWRKLLDRAGLADPTDHLHFHALRHFAASWWIISGLPLTDTASLMGHSKVDMTLQVYAHALVGGTRRAEVLEGMSAALLAPETMKRIGQSSVLVQAD